MQQQDRRSNGTELVYALLDAAVLCRDLTRLPSGCAVAGALQRALRLGPTDLDAVAAGFSDDADRRAAWAQVEAACGRRARTAEARAGSHRLPPGALGDAATARAAARKLARSTYGGLPHVVDLVRTDILDWTWHGGDGLRLQTAPRAVAVVCDAVAACYAGTAISPRAFTRLREPWTSVLRGIDASRPGSAEEFGPATLAVRRIPARLAASTPGQLAALDRALDTARAAGFDWAARMHSATWAVQLAGRTRVAAAAQFAAVRAMPPATASLAPGAALTVSATVQAVVVADLLDAETYGALTGPWRAVFPTRLPG